MTPVCLERTSRLGGIWNYSETPQKGQASVMKSTIVNSSKEFMAFSDFPPPKDFPNFMHHSKVLEYYKQYVDKFGLEQYIQYNTEVIHLTETDGKWIATIQNGQEERRESFDFVLVCSGHLADTNEPKFPREDEFKGLVLHSHDYRTTSGFEDKNVLIIGLGNSAVDIAVELSHVTKQVYTSLSLCFPLFFISINCELTT